MWSLLNDLVTLDETEKREKEEFNDSHCKEEEKEKLIHTI